MNIIYDIGKTVCTGGLVVGVLSVFTSSKGVGRTVRIVIGLYFVISVLVAVSNLDLSLDHYHFAETMNTSVNIDLPNTESILLAETKETLEKIVSEQIIEKFGFQAEEIDLEIDIDDASCIYCTKAIVYIDEQYKQRSEEVKRSIQELVGTETEIRVG